MFQALPRSKGLCFIVTGFGFASLSRSKPEKTKYIHSSYVCILYIEVSCCIMTVEHYLLLFPSMDTSVMGLDLFMAVSSFPDCIFASSKGFFPPFLHIPIQLLFINRASVLMKHANMNHPSLISSLQE